jgi:hypothetical protein
MMIVSYIAGGIGNQLFMYATGRRLAIKNNTDLKLDISSYKNDSFKRDFCLNHFNIKAEIASEYESFQTCFGNFRKKWRWRISKRLPFHLKNFIVEDPNSDDFYNKMMNLKIGKNRNVYLHGYWGEKYFKDIAPIIRDELKVITKHDEENLAVAEKIKSCNAICLHARRLHLVPNQKNPKPNPDAEQVSNEFYQSAIQEIESKIQNPHFFCFADYHPWIKENLIFNSPVKYITHNNKNGDESKNYEDLWLMSLCKHHIIANSTFSWWGAWLSDNEQKILIKPSAKDLIKPHVATRCHAVL